MIRRDIESGLGLLKGSLPSYPAAVEIAAASHVWTGRECIGSNVSEGGDISASSRTFTEIALETRIKKNRCFRDGRHASGQAPDRPFLNFASSISVAQCSSTKKFTYLPILRL